MCEVDDVLREIMAIRARTAGGLRLKVRVAEAASFDPEELLPSLIADIEAMAGRREALS